MNTKGKNRSVQRTQALLKDGLTELMQTKPVQNITVRELTDHVNLNRGTFYLHYKDIQDLLEHLENDILDEFIEITNSHQPQDMKGKPFPLICDLYKFLEKNSDFVRLILVNNQEQNFENRLKDILRERCTKDWDEIFANADPKLSEIYSSYVLSGCIGIIENWIRNDTRQSPEELARYTEDIMLKGLNILK
ncbi:TetR/AcrR family transcriptional regulator [Blautia sp. MSJ-19]|uniref:TetR/AcrR family transcriptional regulator n=1 Tax=Blautia sp. MSJ-19 TaxID=2841517 RepID=UPI001C0ED7EA|nr:TetR/AcrR family transcriptional regulator [Blautia sp. MSJ-19]MBU5479957.1 TetR/AcrR family transcriptional regulator [Blautia sp. MSJ-19]